MFHLADYYLEYFFKFCANRYIFRQHKIVNVFLHLGHFLFLVHEERNQFATRIGQYLHRYLGIGFQAGIALQRSIRAFDITFYITVCRRTERQFKKRPELCRNHYIALSLGNDIAI